MKNNFIISSSATATDAFRIFRFVNWCQHSILHETRVQRREFLVHQNGFRHVHPVFSQMHSLSLEYNRSANSRLRPENTRNVIKDNSTDAEIRRHIPMWGNWMWLHDIRPVAVDAIQSNRTLSHHTQSNRQILVWWPLCTPTTMRWLNRVQMLC